MNQNNQPSDQAEEPFAVVDTSDGRQLKIFFTPGCFDDFDGTQEELNDLIAEIKGLVASGEVFKKATPVDEDDPILQRIAATEKPNTRQ